MNPVPTEGDHAVVPSLDGAGGPAAAESSLIEAPPPSKGDSVRNREMGVALRNGIKMGGSLLITWTVAMIVKLHVPAHLGPVRQGHFGFAENFASMFFSTLALGVDTHIMKEVAVRPRYASEVVGGVFVIRVFLAIVLFVAMGLTLLTTHRTGDILGAALIFGVSNCVAASNATLGAVLQAVSKVGPAAVANVIAKVLWGGGLLVGLYYDAPLPVLAIPALASESVRTMILTPATIKGADLKFRVDVPETKKALLESVPYFVNGLALGILSSLGMSVLEFIKKDEREVGWFAAVQNLGYLCMLLSPLLFWVVMPLLSRAQARSEAEGGLVFRRCLEGIVVAIIPMTVLISAGSDFLVRAAFGPAYAPAHTGLSILSLVFIMTYANMLMALNLIVLKRGWSVTFISISAVFVTSGMMLVFVPLGRHLIGEGGECAGAAAAVIGSEACTLVAMLTRFDKFPLDRRNISSFAKSLAIGGGILLLNRFLLPIGPARLVLEAVLYVALAFAAGVVRLSELKDVIRIIRHRGNEPIFPAP